MNACRERRNEEGKERISKKRSVYVIDGTNEGRIPIS
jgi:hypothetical protein